MALVSRAPYLLRLPPRMFTAGFGRMPRLDVGAIRRHETWTPHIAAQRFHSGSVVGALTLKRTLTSWNETRIGHVAGKAFSVSNRLATERTRHLLSASLATAATSATVQHLPTFVASDSDSPQQRHLPSSHPTSPDHSSSPPDPANHTLRWSPPPAFHPSIYTSLSKARLALLVVLTTACGYAVAPGAASLSILTWTTLGTTLCVASANAFNQWAEAPFDAQMRRTRGRPLVRYSIGPAHAWLFGVTSGVAGFATLWSLVNPAVALLGGLNIALYAAVYTPLKRFSVANTWVGAVVGAIPPVMGYLAAAPGSLAVSAAPWVLAAVLYCWQFPHFNGLSWNLVADYSKAGYRMMAVTDPQLTTRVALRHSIALILICWAAPLSGLTTPLFALTSTVPNLALATLAWSFWRAPGEKTARTLFFGSLLHLPVIMALMMVHKAGAEEKDVAGVEGGDTDGLEGQEGFAEMWNHVVARARAAWADL